MAVAAVAMLGCSTGISPKTLAEGYGDTEGGSMGPDDDTLDGSLPPDPTLPPGPDGGCEPGTEGCSCTAEGSCDPGLGCEFDLCLPAGDVCGDGVVGGFEECDEGLNNADDGVCKSDCTEQVCGDGFVGPAEACDDGNEQNDDECSNECKGPECGDGVVQPGEECDDNNDNDHDGCLNTCLDASCGDGVVHTGEEQCDDGDGNDDDGCTRACSCQLSFENDQHIDGWERTGDWGLYTSAPPSEWLPVSFVSQGQVFGTDGNRSAPYPGEEQETSHAITPSFVIPETLRFRSWNVDEGSFYDNKRISLSVDGEAEWTLLVDCHLGPNDDLEFCQFVNGPRNEDDWDDIELDLSAFAGMSGRLRFAYQTADEDYPTDQGWFIDDLNGLGCP